MKNILRHEVAIFSLCIGMATFSESAVAQSAPNNPDNIQACAIGESTNIGVQVNTRGRSSKRSLACGVGTEATGGDATAVGPAAKAIAEKSTAIGTDSVASATNSVALGYGSIANRANTVSVGTITAPRQIVNVASGTQPNDAVNLSQLDAVTIIATAADQNASTAIVFGNAALARAFRGVTYVPDPDGRNSNVVDLAVGSFGQGLVTITNLAAGINPTDAVNKAQLDAVIARNNLQGVDIDSVQIGNGCQAIAGKSVCVGFGNRASGNGAVAIGDPNIATGTGAVAIGADNTATGDGAVALGNNSTANGTGNVAIGNGAQAAAANSVAIGNGSVANVANSFSVGFVGGERRIMNVANGSVAAGSTDAVNGGQLFAAQATASNAATAAANAQTSANAAQATANTALANAATAQASANSALANAATAQGTANAALTSAAAAQSTANAAVAQNTVQDAQIASIQTLNATQNSRLTALETLTVGAIPALQSLTNLHTTQISELFALTDRDRRDARRGSATALALTAAPMPSNVGGVSYALNAATYRGEKSIGLSFAYRANTENPFALTGGISYAGGDSVGARVGVAGEF